MSNAYLMGTMKILPWMLVFAASAPGQAANFEFGDAQFTFNNRFVLGAALRLQSPNPNTIGKLNNNPDLCPDDCISFNQDPEPNQRLVDAPGGFAASNNDNGNLNYEKYDFVNAQARLESEMIIQYGLTSVKVSGIGFYDRITSVRFAKEYFLI